MMLLPIFMGGALAFAQLPPPTPAPAPSPSPDDTWTTFMQLVQAWQGKQYVVVGAFVVGVIIAASKSGWLGTWLATKVPPQARPFLAVVVGILTVSATEMKAGVEWKTALLHAIFAAATAVLGHQMVVEGLRNGKEIMPKGPWHPDRKTGAPPPGSGGSSGPPKLDATHTTTIALESLRPCWTRR
jgi:hypothetical protein